MLEIHHLTVAYGRKTVVHDISFDVAQGEFVGILGANGAGKTSILESIMGVAPGKAESLKVGGVEAAAMAIRRRIDSGLALVPEGRQIFPGLTVAENLDLAYDLAHQGRRQASDRSQIFNQSYELFPKLVSRRKQLAGTLSGGEQQMVALARGLLSEPTVLMLDEPSLGLAPAVVDEVMDILVRLNASGLTIVMVEQDASRTLEIANRCYVLERGRFVLDGPSADLLNNPGVHEAFLGI